MSGNTERQRRQIRLGSVEIDVVDEGSGPAIVLLPSLGRDSFDYDDVAEGLVEKGFRVLRPQPRGLGNSTGPTEGLKLDDLADDVAAVLRVLETGPAVIVGHAFGNWIARVTATRHPDLVRGVVIAAAASKTYPPELTVKIRRIAEPGTPQEERLQLLRETFFAPGNDATVWLDGWHADVRAYQFAAHKATDQASWWQGGTGPVLDLVAGDDPFREVARRNEIRDELGPDRVTVHVVANASHALLPEQPRAVVDAIASWIAVQLA